MSNGRFSISIHILTLLASAGGELLSSEFIAGSISINPVLVRKEMSNLRKKGFIATKEGKNGGISLAKSADQILLSEVYRAVHQAPLLVPSKNEPNPACPIGRQINGHLNDLYEEAEKALVDKLNGVTLANFLQRFD